MAKKAILVPYARACEWSSEFFPGLSISALPVVENGRVVGMLTSEQLSNMAERN